jgi:hypothetical protein
MYRARNTNLIAGMSLSKAGSQRFSVRLLKYQMWGCFVLVRGLCDPILYSGTILEPLRDENNALTQHNIP